MLLLDEPLGALDKKLREETQFELIKIQESLGVTFVVVTHDQEEAMTLSSRIGVMTAGEIVQVGTPREIYEYPRNRFVADFIGSVNIFEGRIAEDGESHVIVASPEAGLDIYVPHSISDASVYQIRLDNGKRVRVTQTNLTRSEESTLNYGDRVNLGWDGSAGVVVTS